MSTPSRRGLLSGAAASAAVGLVPAGAAAANPDAELIAKCREAVALETEWREEMKRDPEGVAPEHGPRWYQLVEEIESTAAKTDEGNRAKLSLVIAYYDPDFLWDSEVSDIMWDAIHGLVGSEAR